MVQNKKTEERKYLESFLKTSVGCEWLKKYNISTKTLEETERPDFTFLTNDNKKIGIEITQFIAKSEQGQSKAVLNLKRIGDKLCKYTLSKYNLPISIIIDKQDKRNLVVPRTYEDQMKVWYDKLNNPGFVDLFDEKEIRNKVEPIIDQKIEKLRRFPSLVKEWVKIGDEFLLFSISGFPPIDGEFNCIVNNQSFALENPFKELQNEIDKKNKKYNEYSEKCEKCFLLVYSPDSFMGNYCYFTNKIARHKFSSKFNAVFLYDTQYDTRNECLKLKTVTKNKVNIPTVISILISIIFLILFIIIKMDHQNL